MTIRDHLKKAEEHLAAILAAEPAPPAEGEERPPFSTMEPAELNSRARLAAAHALVAIGTGLGAYLDKHRIR